MLSVWRNASSSLSSSSSSPTCTRNMLHLLFTSPLPSLSRHISNLPRRRSILDDDTTPVDLTEDNEAVNGTRAGTPPPHLRAPPDKPTPHEYKEHRKAMRKDFPTGWSPPRKLSREAMEGLRQMHNFDPEKFTTPILAEKFRISPEAVRRILKSKWEPSEEKKQKMQQREKQQRSETTHLKRIKEWEEATAIAEEKESAKSRGPDGSLLAGVSGNDRFTFR